MQKLPLGQRIHATLVTHGPGAALAIAQQSGHPDLFDRISSVASEDPTPSFLHSALCAMSLPVRRPPDETRPILRQDGQYTLAITPKPVLRPVDGQQQLCVLGVPYGSLPRLILIHVMTEAVRNRSRHIALGTSFTDWMRRMGHRTVSFGPRGSATLVRQQLDRLLACEWMIRWDGTDRDGGHEFAIKEIKLTNQYAGTDAAGGSYLREILLTESFYDHLREHAVPLNEHAIRELRESATALDLYTWLAYRLPRVSAKRPTTLSWQQLAGHFGNEGRNIRKFRQTVRDAWERHVSGVYPEARAEFDTTVVRLHASPPPLQRRVVPGITLVPPPTPTDDPGTPEAPGQDPAAAFLLALRTRLGTVEARVWLADARLEHNGEGWTLLLPTAFKADWLRLHQQDALEHARLAAGLAQAPSILARPR